MSENLYGAFHYGKTALGRKNPWHGKFAQGHPEKRTKVCLSLWEKTPRETKIGQRRTVALCAIATLSSVLIQERTFTRRKSRRQVARSGKEGLFLIRKG